MIMYIGYYVMLLLNMLSAFSKKHSKIIFNLTFIFIWILYFGNNDNPDLINYESIYNGNDLNIEKGFKFIIQLSKHFNIDFKLFICIISLICLFLIFSTVSKFTTNINYVIALYIIYPFVFDVIQLRNFIAMSIIIFSIRFLFKNDIKNKIYYVICVCLAASIHKLMLVYIIFLFINLKNKNRLIKVMIVFTMFFCALIFLNGNAISFLNKVMPLSEEKYNYYFSNKLRYGFLIYWSFSLLYLLLVYISRKRVKYNWGSTEKYSDSLRFVDLVFWINVLSVTFFPLYMLNIDFYRLFRNLSILNYTVYAITNDSYIKTTNKGKFTYNFYVIGGLALMFIYDVGRNYGHVFKPILENNIFIK